MPASLAAKTNESIRRGLALISSAIQGGVQFDTAGTLEESLEDTMEVLLPRVQLFKAGDYGKKGSFDEKYIATLSENYNKSSKEAPVILDHIESRPGLRLDRKHSGRRRRSLRRPARYKVPRRRREEEGLPWPLYRLLEKLEWNRRANASRGFVSRREDPAFGWPRRRGAKLSRIQRRICCR